MWMAIFSQEKTFVNVMFMVCFQFQKKKSCATWWQPFAETLKLIWIVVTMKTL